VLASRGPQNLVGLAEAVGVTPATATRMCDRLVKKKLVVRQAELDDRRQIRLALTKKGIKLISAVTDRRRREIETIVRAIDPKEQHVLVLALGQFAAAAGEVPEQDWSTGWDL
jgi:DNA-binding MarR family transcriptional regulator